MRSYIGEVDPHGHEFKVQELCVVDEVTQQLVCEGYYIAFRLLVSGVDFTFDDDATMAPVLRDISRLVPLGTGLRITVWVELDLQQW